MRLHNFYLASFFLALTSPAFAADSLHCSVARPTASALLYQGAIVEGQASVNQREMNELGLEFDASLARDSFLWTLQDRVNQQRLAFVGSALFASPEGARLSTNQANMSCRRELGAGSVIALRPRLNLPEYLVCVLDEAIFEGGESKEPKREIISRNSSVNFRMRQRIHAENEKYSFTVSYLSYDPKAGLEVEMVDKSNGQTAKFSGPGQAFLTSFLMAFTQGSRDANGKYLRLGCAYTSDPALFNQL